MTEQIHDCFVYKGQTLSFIDETDPKLPRPSHYGINTTMESTANRKGYHNTFAIIDGYLAWVGLTGTVNTEEVQLYLPEINGVKPKTEGDKYIQFEYADINLRLDYTGTIGLGINYSFDKDRYEKEALLTFDRGKLVEEILKDYQTEDEIRDEFHRLLEKAPAPDPDLEMERLLAIKAEIKAKQVSCPACGAPNDRGDTACRECGNQLPPPSQSPSQSLSAPPLKPKEAKRPSFWMKWKGPVIEYRRKYLQELLREKCGLFLEPPGRGASPPLEQVLEALSMVQTVNLGGGDIELDLVPFIRYVLQDKDFELPYWGDQVWNDSRSLVDMAYWVSKSGETEHGTPRQILERARKLLPPDREAAKSCNLGNRSLFWLHRRLATALVDLLGDRQGALEILSAARETLGKTGTGGRDHVAVARGYLDAFGDTATALALAKELLPNLKDASSHVELGALLIDLGELELARGVLTRLQENGNASAELPVERWTWEELAQLWLDLDDALNASLCLDAAAVEGARPPPVPREERNFVQMATRLFDKGTRREVAL